MQQVTLQPGDYVLTEGMTEEQYHAVARAFMNAGANEGEYPNTKYALEADLECFGVSQMGFSLFHGDKAGSGFSGGRQLTIDQVLSATNGSNAAPPSRMNCRCVMNPIIKEADMHITDELHKALQIRDEAQARYEQVLAEHREAYPWLVIEERKQPTEDMIDPANWRAGDIVRCIKAASRLYTTGNVYEVVNDEKGNPIILDNDRDGTGTRPTAAVSCFRFHSRP